LENITMIGGEKCSLPEIESLNGFYQIGLI